MIAVPTERPSSENDWAGLELAPVAGQLALEGLEHEPRPAGPSPCAACILGHGTHYCRGRL